MTPITESELRRGWRALTAIGREKYPALYGGYEKPTGPSEDPSAVRKRKQREQQRIAIEEARQLDQVMERIQA